MPEEIENPVPKRFARVMDAGEVEHPSRLGPPGQGWTFVTAAEDLAGCSARELSSRLGIPPAEQFWVIEFPATAIEGPVASAIREEAQCFTGGGRTRGGAREFHIQNQSVPLESSRRIVT